MSVKKIAAAAGVSVATVSRVLHRSGQVTPHTRELVEDAMKELGYSVKDLARVTRSETGVIGLVMPDLSDAFSQQIASGVQEAARREGICVFVCDLCGEDAAAGRYLELLAQANVRGVILAFSAGADDSVRAEQLCALTRRGISVVLIDRDSGQTDFDSVYVDNASGAYEATKLLLDEGHKSIAVIAGSGATKPGRERLEGYCAAYRAAGIPLDRSLIFYSDCTVKGGREQTQAILAEHPEASALLSTDDRMTIGALEALNRAGKQIPRDIAFVGVDGARLLPSLGLPITVVDRPTRELGRYAVDLICRAMVRRAGSAVTRVTLMPELRIRGSEKKLASQELAESGQR